jgi:hypothetical protein
VLPRALRPGPGSLLLAAWFLCLAGCSGGPKICRVTGTVRYKGKAVPHLTVLFVPDEGRESIGTTDDEGNYKLMSGRTTEGAARGTHRVYFAYRPRTPQEEIDLHAGKITLPPDVTAVLDKYGSLASTPLKYEVTTDGQVIDIPLD